MTSDVKCQANKRNAGRSTGPRTAEGKRRASQNALRHGLSKTIASNALAAAEVRSIANALLASFPSSPPDNSPALRFAAAQLQLNQIARLATALTNELAAAIEHPDSSSAIEAIREMNRLERYVSKAGSRRRKSLRELLRSYALDDVAPQPIRTPIGVANVVTARSDR
jgi:hypothetical protein